MSNASSIAAEIPAAGELLASHDPSLATRAIPLIDPAVRLSPFHERGKDDDRHLVESGNACFVVSRTIHDVIAALRDERPETIGELATAVRRRGGTTLAPEMLVQIVDEVLPRPLFDPALARKMRTPFILRMTLLRKEWTLPITRRLTWMYARPVPYILVTLAAIVAAIAIPRAMTAVHAPFTAREFAILYLAIFLSGIWHELGHATACTRFGCPHGDIGFGLYFIFPAFYSDVTKAWRLPAKQRAAVDLGGIYFQSLVIIGAGAYGIWSGDVIALRFLWITAFMMLHNLNPVFKMDGYWLFSDLTGLTNLHKRIRESVIAHIHRKPASVATPTLVAYLGAVALYAIYLTTFLSRAIVNLATHYPAKAGGYLRAVVEALRSQQWMESSIAFGHFVRISIWPLILSIVVASLLIRIYKFARSIRS